MSPKPVDKTPARPSKMVGQPYLDGLHVPSMEDIRVPSRLVRASASECSASLHEQDKVIISTDKAAQRHSIRKPYNPIEPEQQSKKAIRNPWGLSPSVFALLVATITAIIVGAAVGGGMSAALKERTASQSNSSGGNSQNPNSTSATGAICSPSPTGLVKDYIPVLPPQVETLATKCPSINNTVVRSFQGPSFYVSCGHRIIHDDSNIPLTETVAYTLEGCINDCSMMNFWANSTICTSITWNRALAALAKFEGGNCWLYRKSSDFTYGVNSTTAVLAL